MTLTLTHKIPQKVRWRVRHMARLRWSVRRQSRLRWRSLVSPQSQPTPAKTSTMCLFCTLYFCLPALQFHCRRLHVYLFCSFLRPCVHSSKFPRRRIFAGTFFMFFWVFFIFFSVYCFLYHALVLTNFQFRSESTSTASK